MIERGIYLGGLVVLAIHYGIWWALAALIPLAVTTELVRRWRLRVTAKPYQRAMNLLTNDGVAEDAAADLLDAAQDKGSRDLVEFAQYFLSLRRAVR